MSRRKKRNKQIKLVKGKAKKSHSEFDLCKGCGYYPCIDSTLGCETSKTPKTHFQLCFECEEVKEIAYDGNMQEYFCCSCGSTIEDKMIKLPESIKKGSNSYSGGYGNSMGYSGYDTQIYVACDHTGDKVIFEKDGKKLYAANNKGLNEYSGAWELIIDLAGIVTLPSPGFVKKENNKRFDVLRPHTGKYSAPKSEILRLDWPDFAAPAVTPDFWLKLWELLPEKTVICCQGGHGRTGTCLAAFMISQGVDYYSAFTTVRTEHCQKAIESQSQARYLHGLYAERLKRQLTEAITKGDNETIPKIQAAVKFAADHIPSTQDLLGNSDPDPAISTAAKGAMQQSPRANEKVVHATKVDMLIGNEIKRQCPKCEGWIRKSINWNDYWCNICRHRIEPKQTEIKTLVDDGKDFIQDTLKRIEGVLYIKTCVKTDCLAADSEECDDVTHLAWVKWDDYQHLEASVE